MPLNDESKMPFGRHKDFPMKAIPESYLVYLYDNGLKPGDVRTYIETHVAPIVNRLQGRKDPGVNNVPRAYRPKGPSKF